MFGITNANYGVNLGDKIYANLAPNASNRYIGFPDYSFDKLYWTTLIVHEFAHSFINPFTEVYRDIIAQKNIKPYAKILKTLHYGTSLETYINETVIRAIECMYIKNYFPDNFDEYINDYYDEGYCKIKETFNMVANPCNVFEEKLIRPIIDLF